MECNHTQAIVKDPQPRAHSVFPPSGAERWLACTASPMMSKQYGVYTTSSDAEAGTKAHELAEACAVLLLAEDMNPKEIVQDIDDEELRSCMQVYLDAIEDTYEAEPSYFETEARIDLSKIYGVPNQFGYADLLVVSDKTLHVVDYKHGVGIPVSPVRNKQLMIYAWGVLQREDMAQINEVVLHIVQPRAPGKPAVEQWRTTREELGKFGVDLVLAIADANRYINDGNAPVEAFAPSFGTCRFCPAKASCSHFSGKTSTELGLPKQLPAPALATDQQLGQVLSYRKMINQWFDVVEEEVFDRIQSGRTVPGWKLVLGNQGIRRWTDKKAAEEAIRTMRVPVDYAYKKEIISPTQAEKLLKVSKPDGKPMLGDRQWKALQELITRNEGAPTLVVESDARPALEFSDTDDLIGELADEEPTEGATGVPIQEPVAS